MGLPSSIYLDLSLSLSYSSVFDTTPMRMSIDLMSVRTLSICFLIFYKGLLFPIFSVSRLILSCTLVRDSLTSISSDSKSWTFLVSFWYWF